MIDLPVEHIRSRLHEHADRACAAADAVARGDVDAARDALESARELTHLASWVRSALLPIAGGE